MQRDIRSTPEGRAVWDFYTALLAPGSGRPYSGFDLAPLPDGAVAFTGMTFQGALEDGPSSAIHLARADGSAPRVGPFGSRLARPSPDGTRLAFVAPDPDGPGDRLFLAAADSSNPQPAGATPGIIEQVRWSPDGASILTVVAGLGADLAGYQGGYATKADGDDGPAWLPEVATGKEANLWRRLWLHDPATGAARLVSADGVNVWEASWCGPERIGAVCTRDHSEGAWYRATLDLIEAASGAQRTVHEPKDQIALPAGSPDGKWLAFVEAFCSDRGILCGPVKLVELATGAVRTIDTGGAEATSLAWRDGGRLVFGGVRTAQTVIGEIDAATGAVTETLATEEFCCGEWYPNAWPYGADGYVFVREAYAMAPEIAVLEGGEVRTLLSFASSQARQVMAGKGAMRSVTWTAPDGLEIQGWLAAQDGGGARPLVLDIHGGPVWACQNRWMGRLRAAALLVERGYAVLFPNPRGSGGRGQDFARGVHGDMGGADTYDYISGADALVAQGLADESRLACTGSSYGGFMSCWLVTQDQRFAAAAPISPVANWYSQHRTSQIPYFDELLLQASAYEPGGRFFERSPANFAARVRTPVLLLAGALDKNTPPTQALEFHQAMKEFGGESALVVYPQDGHSLRGYPAFLDSAARILIWFGEWIG
jgi:dipeptidyl aminopeptidase/acylaminoacyl peptidase